MNLFDVITLAKAGYKKADIDALKDQESELEKVAPVKPATDGNISSLSVATGAGEEGSPAPASEEKKEEPDYKKLYEESQAVLKEAQATNIAKAGGNEAVDIDTEISDIISSLL